MEKELLSSDDKVKEIFDTAAANLPVSRKLPGATYRLQFNHQFTFSKAKGIVSDLTGETVQEDERQGKKVLPLDGVLANFPVALLERKRDS